ncbi:unnamed protein product [Diabrotica balteata]|uniref:RNA-directed DNA polymerase n=1 Tax=Diabrotica balteata TaxID=107213 RepID=A0A9N9X939_DIABA|nr:unnamed protein product [Diabrotica balteata]
MISDLSIKEIPLLELLRKGVKWKWDQRRELAFQEIKNIFLSNLKIYHPDYTKPFILRTDASIERLSGVLLQIHDGVEYPIQFISRITKPHEKGYSVSELELASIIHCVTKLRFYLLGKEFTIETDHQALTSILNNKYGNSRIHRWSLILSEYSFEIKYISGKSNIVADALSRLENTSQKRQRTIKIGLNRLVENTGLYSKEEIIRNQINLDEKQKVLKKNGVFYKIIIGLEVYVISRILARKILKDLHKSYMHIGSRKLWMLFRDNYFAKNDISIAKEITTQCQICQINKEKNFKNQNTYKSNVAYEKLNTVAMDFISNLVPSPKGNKHILVIVDLYTKFIKLYPCSRTNVKTLKLCINQFFEEIGPFRNCIIDNATYFNNQKFQTFCEKKGINIHFTSIRHPQANPAERYIKKVIKYLRILCQGEQVTWQDYIEEVEYFLNNTHNLNTEEVPEYLMFDHIGNRKWISECTQDMLEQVMQKVNRRIQRKAEKYIRRQNRTIKKPITFQKGDKVLIRSLRQGNLRENRCKKLQPLFEGPYIVQNQNGLNSYVLIDAWNKLRGIFHINDIFKYFEEVECFIYI